MTNDRKKANEQRARDRQRISQADPVGFLIDVMEGRPMPVRDKSGHVIGAERVEAPLRAAAAEKLMRRILPELASVDVTSSDGSAGVTFQIASPFPLPGSNRPDVIEGKVDAGQLGDDLRGVTDAVEVPNTADEAAEDWTDED